MPLGLLRLWIRFWYHAFYENVVLVPDLEAYDPRPRSGRPGVEANLTLPGWKLRHSYFTMPLNSYNTNFGLDNYQGQREFPELYFNIEIQRLFISPFVTHLIPLFVILITLFILLSVTGREGASVIGFSSMGAIATVVGIFFVVIFQHIAMRRTLQAEGFVYLEIFYFLTYLYILLVTVNSVVTVLDLSRDVEHRGRSAAGLLLFAPLAIGKVLLMAGARFLNRGGNQTMRYVYWPLYFGLVWAVTLLLTVLAG